MQFPFYTNLGKRFLLIAGAQNRVLGLLKVNVGCDDFMAHNSKTVLRKWALFGHEGIHAHALQLYGSIKIYKRELYMDKI